MVGGIGFEPFDLYLHGKKVGIGLGENPRRHEAAFGQKLERARQLARFGIGFETMD
ncbi:hypothetical protein D3C83_331280 [compost metagenome]